MSAALTDRHAQLMDRIAPPVAAVGSLIVIIDGLSRETFYHPMRWPLATIAVLLGVGLTLDGRSSRRGTIPSAHALAAVVSLFIVVLTLPRGSFASPDWPAELAAVILGVGLAAGPLTRLARGRLEPRSVQTLAAIAGTLVLIYALPSGSFFAHKWLLQLAAGILVVGLGADLYGQRGRRPAPLASPHMITAVAALTVLIYALTTFDYYESRWPEQVTVVIIGLGIVAGPLIRLLAGPPENVLTERVAELSRTRRGALDVQASELRRIERDLHDGAQARLVALSMKLGRAEDRFRDDPETAALLREAREDASMAIRELRELARGIAPPVLTDRGLRAAADSLAQRSDSRIKVSGELTRRPLPAVETAAYFVVAESLTNAAKHAPDARVEVRLDERGGDLFVEVTDFGPGGADPAGGGLTGLRQRVEALDGALHVTSPAGVGTQVEAVMPCGW